MSDVVKSEEFDAAPEQDFVVPKTDDSSTEISELSKKGYQLLKENRTDDAIDAFLQRRFHGRKPDRAACKRATDALLRRGHSWNDIRRALERYAPEEEFYEDAY